MPIKICEDNKCTACYACFNACPAGAISMRCDEYGELHPSIDNDICTECNLCVESCPNNIEMNFREPQACYASWITDTQDRERCASGGVGTLLSRYIIEHGGVVFGTRYNDDMEAVTTFAREESELEYFKGSKYVISDVGSAYREIESYLLREEQVLYISTPCQVAGLLAYLGRDYENLITVDLICHGVVPAAYLKEEIEYITRNKRIEGVTYCGFRSNDRNNYAFTLRAGERVVFRQKGQLNPYFCGFSKGITHRESCRSCNYARPERVSDITIGDFIFLGKRIPFDYPTKNVSSVFINTERAKALYAKIASLDCYVSIERTLAERLDYAPSLLHPFPRHELVARFRAGYVKHGFAKAIRRTLFTTILQTRIEKSKRKWMNSISKLPRKIQQIFTRK